MKSRTPKSSAQEGLLGFPLQLRKEERQGPPRGSSRDRQKVRPDTSSWCQAWAGLCSDSLGGDSDLLVLPGLSGKSAPSFPAQPHPTPAARS